MWLTTRSIQPTQNLGKNRSAALSGFLNCNISAKMRLSLNGRLQYTDLNSPNPLFGHADRLIRKTLRASGRTGNFGASFNYTMPGNVKLNAYGGKNFGLIQLSSRSNGWYYYGISFSRSFLRNDALTVTASASNFPDRKTQIHKPQPYGDHTLIRHQRVALTECRGVRLVELRKSPKPSQENRRQHRKRRQEFKRKLKRRHNVTDKTKYMVPYIYMPKAYKYMVPYIIYRRHIAKLKKHE